MKKTANTAPIINTTKAPIVPPTIRGTSFNSVSLVPKTKETQLSF